ncbi:MAG: ATP phosphoribosyltransferase regulatory subunit [Oscillospiraceae bacterium]|nr:ATP phosphoribosyltransferase regulatory subunit [Oscillospiraceae bacterium]
MKKCIKITPEGAKDYLFKECAACKQISASIEKVFKMHEFKQVMTPGIEFYDLFTIDSYSIEQETMFKTVDNKGRLLAVRPDSTLPIARLVATRLKNKILPARLYYNQSVYRNNRSLTGRNNEIKQMGIELLGATGKRADLEILTTAIQSIESVTDNYRIELGHSEFFNALANQLSVSEEEKEEIRFTIESKNYSALNNLLDKLEETPAVNAIRTLPGLFGGEEVFDKAAEIFRGTEAMKSLDYLKELYRELSTLNLKNKLSIDLGLVQRNDYYNGFVFCGYVEGFGDAVISGGRYDSLLEKFDAPMGAAGFAINVNALAQIYLDDEKVDYDEKPDVLVFANEGNEMKAIKHTSDLINAGKKAQFCVLDSLEKAKEYAEKRGIENIEII